MHHIHHRTWFPFILVGLTLALAAGIYAWSAQHQPVEQERQGQEASTRAMTLGEYRDALEGVLDGYEADGDAEAAYDALLEMRVPGELKGVHLDFVIAFDKLLADDPGAMEALDQAREASRWLFE